MTGLVLRPLVPADVEVLDAMLHAPHVARWWHPTPETAASYVVEDGTSRYLALVDDRPVGFGQCYVWDEQWAAAYGIPVGTAGIDYLVGHAVDCERGLGTALVAALVAACPAGDVWATPEAANEPSCRVLERNGFERMAVKQCRVPEEPWAGPTALYRLSR